MEAAFRCMENLNLVSAWVMEGLRHIDPIQHDGLSQVYQYRQERFSVQRAVAAIDPVLQYEGREIVFNRWSAPHWDKHDPHFGWACIIYFGDFEEAWLEFPQINVRVRLRPGDVVWFRGRDLLHQALNWTAGSRHFLIHFTHTAMWNMAGVQCQSSKAK